jgi:hypothetical protein
MSAWRDGQHLMKSENKFHLINFGPIIDTVTTDIDVMRLVSVCLHCWDESKENRAITADLLVDFLKVHFCSE